MSTFSHATFIIRSSPLRTSNVGSPSPTRRMMRNFVATATAAAGATRFDGAGSGMVADGADGVDGAKAAGCSACSGPAG